MSDPAPGRGGSFWPGPEYCFGAFGRFCSVGERGVVVLDDVTVVRVPTSG